MPKRPVNRTMLLLTLLGSVALGGCIVAPYPGYYAHGYGPGYYHYGWR